MLTSTAKQYRFSFLYSIEGIIKGANINSDTSIALFQSDLFAKTGKDKYFIPIKRSKPGVDNIGKF